MPRTDNLLLLSGARPGLVAAHLGGVRGPARSQRCHPDPGSELKQLLSVAGFAGIRPTASFEISSDPAEIDSVFGFRCEWFLADSTAAAAMLGRAQLDTWRDDLIGWRNDCGAFAGYAFGEALADRP